MRFWEFPSGPVTENLPDKAGDTGLISGPQSFQMPWGS